MKARRETEYLRDAALMAFRALEPAARERVLLAADPDGLSCTEYARKLREEHAFLVKHGL